MALARQFAGKRQITWLWLVGFLLALLALTWLLIWGDATRKVDRLLHDGWVRLQQREAPDDIVIAAIDAQSLQAIGRWPWSREIQSEVVNNLADAGVRALVSDILYIEPSARADDDRLLADALARIPVAILPVLVEGQAGQTALERLPISTLVRHTDAIGHIVLPIDDDGIVRRTHLKAGFRRAHWPALSLALSESLATTTATHAERELPGRRLATAQSGDKAAVTTWVQDHEVYIPFYGPSGRFTHVPILDILDQRNLDQLDLKGKIVFFGLTTTGLGDVVPTPVSALDQPMPGVEIHANIFSALRDGSLVTAVDPRVNLLLALLIMPLMLAAYSRMPAHWSLPTTAALAIAPIVVSFLMYRYLRLWYPPLALSVPMLVCYLFWSRHRLDFISHFLANQANRNQPVLSTEPRDATVELTRFFQHAVRHLPIKGWRFSSAGEVRQGGEGLPPGLGRGEIDRWKLRRGVGVKSWGRGRQLTIEIAYSDSRYASEINEYVDSLARVRSKHAPVSRLSSFERLQTNALRVGEQLAWLEGVKEFSESVLEGSPVGLIIWNPAGEAVRINDLAKQLVPSLGRSRFLADFLGGIGYSVEHGSNKAGLDALLLEGEPWQLACSIDERELVVNLSAFGGRLSQRLVCASILDVTAVRSAESARAEMIDYLSHDLRSPLVSAIYGLGELRELDGRDAASLKQDVAALAGRIGSSIQSSLQMMEDLLQVARADALDQQQFQEVLLNDLVDNAVDQLMPQASSKNIHLIVDSPDSSLWMLGDASSLQRAFANVIGNAIKYSEENKVVWIQLQAATESSAQLTVEDRGVGIDPSMADQLFKRFKRDARVANRIKGIGLGLAQVARVARIHEGSVEATHLEIGTRMTITLPLTAIEAPE